MKKNKIFYIIGLIFVITIIIAWFYPFNGFYFFWDQQILIRTNLINFSRTLYSWNDFSMAPGFSTSSALSWIYFVGGNLFFKFIFNQNIGQFVYVLLNFLIGYTAIFLLLKKLFIFFNFKSKNNFIIITFCSLVYLFNIFGLLFLYSDFSIYMLFFLFLPIVINAYISYIDNNKKLILFLLSIILISQSFGQPAFLLSLLTYIFIFSFILLYKYNFIFVVKHFFKSVLLVFLASFFVIFPIISFGNDQLNTHLSAAGGNDYLSIYKPFSSPLKTITFNNFRQLTFDSYQATGGFVSFFCNNIYLITALIILLILLIYLNTKNDKKIGSTNLALLSLSILFTSIPYLFFNIFEKIWIKFSFLQILRTWEQKMGHFYLYILIFVFFLTIFSVDKKKYNKQIFAMIVLFVTIFGIYSYPLIEGNFFFNKNHNLKNNPFGENVSSKIIIPKEYMDLNKYFSDKNFSRLLIFPRDQTISSDCFKDYCYAGQNLISEITGVESAVSYNGNKNYSDLLVNNIYNVNIYNDEWLKKIKTLGFSDILVRKRYNKNNNFLLIDVNYEDINSFLIKNTKVLYDSNYFTLYHIDNNSILKSKNLYFKKINPTKYKIYIKNIKSSQDLSFLESFHSQWNLYLEKNPNNSWCEKLEEYNNDGNKITECKHEQKFFEGEELSYLYKKPIFQDSHKIVYDYANQWTIDPEYIKKNFDKSYYKENPDGSIDLELTLYFKPQSYFYLGLIISGTTLVGCVTYLIIDGVKNRKRKDEVIESQTNSEDIEK